VFGYFKVDNRQNILDVVDVNTPPFIRDSHGVWLEVPKVALDILQFKNIHIAASIHAAAHALLSLTPLFVMTSAGEVRTECKAPEKEFASKSSHRKRPAR
jgi:DEAD/DEAH box helicase domain-containing protein